MFEPFPVLPMPVVRLAAICYCILDICGSNTPKPFNQENKHEVHVKVSQDTENEEKWGDWWENQVFDQSRGKIGNIWFLVCCIGTGVKINSK